MVKKKRNASGLQNSIVSDETEWGMIGWGLWARNMKFWVPKSLERENWGIEGRLVRINSVYED